MSCTKTITVEVKLFAFEVCLFRLRSSVVSLPVRVMSFPSTRTVRGCHVTSLRGCCVLRLQKTSPSYCIWGGIAFVLCSGWIWIDLCISTSLISQIRLRYLDGWLFSMCQWRIATAWYRYPVPNLSALSGLETISVLRECGHCMQLDRTWPTVWGLKEGKKGKAIRLQASTGPEGSRSLRIPDFKTIGTQRW
jgi:hypothetical protein